MTTYSKETLKTFFENGDVPTGQNFADLIDSYVNVVDTSAQAISSPLSVPELITSRVSATNVNVTGILSAASFAVGTITGNLNVTGTISAASLNTTGDIICSGRIAASALNVFAASAARLTVTSTVTADTINSKNQATFETDIVVSGRTTTGTLTATGAVSAGDTYVSSLSMQSRAIVSAAGTTQGTATPLINSINRCQGITDASTTGFILLANTPGRIQYAINETAVSGNIYPCVGGTINGGGANAPFPIAAQTLYTIVHTLASAYRIK